jgi:Skp family chaperone for outer membrane proteins
MKSFFTILSVIFTVFLATSVLAAGPEWGWVDGGRLLENHPLMRQFDLQTRRFRDTLSQPRDSEDPSAYIARLDEKLKKMEKTIINLDSHYAGEIAGNGMAARKSYQLYWKKRESLRFYASLLREAIKQASVHGNFYLNMTSDWTLMPVAKGISSTVNEVCEYLCKKNDLTGILDASVFSLRQESLADDVELNQHWAIWRGDQTAITKLKPVCSQIMYSIRNSFPGRAHRPFVAGVIDLNAAAMEMMKAISVPNAIVPVSNDD